MSVAQNIIFYIENNIFERNKAFSNLNQDSESFGGAVFL
jgi:hypothetical protein